MKHLENTPWYICNENDKNLCAYVDTDSNYFNAEPLLKHLYPNFEELSDEDKKAFGDLPLIQLEMLVAKLSKEQRKNVPDVPGAINEGETPKDWVNMPDDERRKNWNRVLQTYMRK